MAVHGADGGEEDDDDDGEVNGKSCRSIATQSTKASIHSIPEAHFLPHSPFGD